MNFSINNAAYTLNVTPLQWTDNGYVPYGNQHSTTVECEVKTIFDLIWVDTMDSVSFNPKTSVTEMYDMLKDNMLYEAQRFYNAGRYNSFMDFAIVSNSAIDYLWKMMNMSEFYKDEDDNARQFIF